MLRLNRQATERVIREALREDAAHRDSTSQALLPTNQRIRARIVAKTRGVLAGSQVAAWTFQAVDRSLRCRLVAREGVRLSLGQTVLTVEGSARAIFAAERTALNLLTHLCGIATLTRAFVERAAPSRAHILDTRKTLPGLRALEKYAVRAGGGYSHRASLSEAVLIKTNHVKTLRLATSNKRQVTSGALIQTAILRARRMHPRRFIEIEVTNLLEFRAALAARPDAMLLDNWRLADIRKAVVLANHEPRTTNHELTLLEVSGGITLANVRATARTGVDRISIGRLTHSAPSLDLSLEVLG